MSQRIRRNLEHLLGQDGLQPWHEEAIGLAKSNIRRIRIKAPYPQLVTTDVVSTYLAFADRRIPRRIVTLCRRGSLVRTNAKIQDLIEEVGRRTSIDKELKKLSAVGRGVVLVDPSDREWRSDPGAVTVVSGTPDNLIPRLLFSHPLDSSNQQPILASLLGHDVAWIVPDSNRLKQSVLTLKRVLEESDTSLPGSFSLVTISATEPDPHISIGIGDFSKDPRIKPLLDAKRTVVVNMFENHKKAVGEQIKALNKRCEEDLFAVSVSVSPKTACQIGNRVKHDTSIIETGTYRWNERQDLDTRIERMKMIKGPRCLVATSAIETGPLVDADIMFCDVPNLDEMLARLEHVNRTGKHLGEIHMFVSKKGLTEDQKATLKFLESLPKTKGGKIDAKLRNLIKATPSLKPETERLNRISTEELDALSLTNMSNRPPTRRWVYNTATNTPRTSLVFREEVDVFSFLLGHPWSKEREQRIGRLAQRCLNLCPILPQEVVSVPTHLLTKRLEADYERGRSYYALFINNGSVVATSVSGERDNTVLANPIRRRGRQLVGKLLVLSPQTGLLTKEGMFDPEGSYSVTNVPDVVSENYVRLLIEKRRGTWVAKNIIGKEELATSKYPYNAAVKACEALGLKGWKIAGMEQLQRPRDESPFYFAVLSKKREHSSFAAGENQTLVDHQKMVGEWSDWISFGFKLGEQINRSLYHGAICHDEGKANLAWQQAIGVTNKGITLAKSKSGVYRSNIAGGYAHELGSLMRLKKTGFDDLTRHLVASHHGRSRPHFRRENFDARYPSKDVRQEVVKAACRFAELQEQYGRWGLAWLETLLRSADVQASRLQVNPEDHNA